VLSLPRTLRFLGAIRRTLYRSRLSDEQDAGSIRWLPDLLALFADAGVRTIGA
jgi:hypothetical protein